MENNMLTTIELKIDTEGIVAETQDLSTELENIEQLLDSFINKISKLFDLAADAVKMLTAEHRGRFYVLPHGT